MARIIMCRVCGLTVTLSDFGYVATCELGHEWPRIGQRFRHTDVSCSPENRCAECVTALAGVAR